MLFKGGNWVWVSFKKCRLTRAGRTSKGEQAIDTVWDGAGSGESAGTLRLLNVPDVAGGDGQVSVIR